MASLSASRYLTPIALLLRLLYFKNVYADFNVSFASKNVDKSPNFGSLFAFYGDAKLVSGSGTRSVQLSAGSVAQSAGTVLYKEPIKLFGRNSRKMVSFDMNIVFSLSTENEDGLAFVMAPMGNQAQVFDVASSGVLAAWSKVQFLAVEFGTYRNNTQGADVNRSHDLASLVSVKISNFSSANWSLNSGEKLQTWIDYEANLKILEVRLGRLGEVKPLDPLLRRPLDLSGLWDKAEVLFSLRSASGNSSQKCNLYSWSLKLRDIPQWMHSEPLDPATFVEKRKELKKVVHEKSDCALRVLAALIFGTGCGALGALLVLFVWTLLGYRRPVVPQDYVVQPVGGLEYKKPIKDGK